MGPSATVSDILQRTKELTEAFEEEDVKLFKERIENAPRTKIAFESKSVPPESSLSITTQATQVSLWLEWLAVHPDAQPHFDILDVRTVHTSLMTNFGPISARMFPVMPEGKETREWAEKWISYGNRRLDVAQTVTLLVANKTNELREFSAVFTCKDLGYYA